MSRWHGVVLALAVVSCSSHRPVAADPEDLPHQHRLEGTASWYGPGFAGKTTAGGEVYDPDGLTAAHRTLPFGSRVHVRNLTNSRTVWVRINDRGPYVPGRIIDLSYAAAQALDMIGPGTARVRLRVAGPTEGGASESPGPTRWWVQLGAFSDSGNAQALAETYQRRGHGAVVHATDGLYRVRLGPHAERAEAETEAETVRETGVALFILCDPC